MWFISLAALALSEEDVTLNDEVDVHVMHQRAEGDALILWFPSESGLLDQEKKQAAGLKEQGIESWYADLLGAWFLAPMASSVDRLPADTIAKLIESIRKKSGKRIYLVASGRGAMTVLRASRFWQQTYGKNVRLGGVILLSPKLYIETPEPGEAGKLMPVISKTNLPVMIIQPENSPWRWKLPEIVASLELSGSDVYVRIVPESRDRFYYRPDATQAENKEAGRLGTLLGRSVRLLKAYNWKSRQVAGKIKNIQKISEKKPRNLRLYPGNPVPPSLKLFDLQGLRHELAQYRGKVVLINFWASWCPPCVEEMPSMQRLKQHFKDKPFKILAINMAERKEVINNFLRTKVNVDFTILLDKDGGALTRWKVFAFPTSYVIGKNGKIRRALFGSIDWMNKDVINKIDVLVNE